MSSLDGVACRVEDLVVRFDEVEAVAGIGFSVGRGEVFGLLGPNGAGKTTTLRVLTTLLHPTSGRASVMGWDVRHDGIRVRSVIGYIPQAISVDGSLTGAENLEFYARVTGVSRRDRRTRIANAVETMGIEPFVDKLARTLSGGMLRRLEIATALLNQPAVLFLDEPTVGLDPTARRAVWERLQMLRAEAGTTIMVTTHQMEEAESECERVAIMDLGKLAALGTPEELREQTGEPDLDGVFAAVTGHELDRKEGSFRNVRAQRKLARRLG
jgi:ABC-2 type transport system ATP-binding protein